MDPHERDHIIDNDREWRSYLIEKIEMNTERISKLEAWTHVFKITGSGLFALLLVYIEIRLK